MNTSTIARRRRATSEELVQGEREIRMADARMQKERLERGEMELEDRKEEETTEAKTPEKGRKQQGTPADSKATPPGFPPLSALPPVPATPVRDPEEEGFGKTMEERSREEGPGKLEDRGRSVVGSEVKGSEGRRTGKKKEAETPAAEGSQGGMAGMPLFTPEQISQLNAIHQQTPWIYNSRDPGISAIRERPLFLESEDRKSEVEERDRKIHQMMILMERDREERIMFMKALDQLKEENQELKDLIRRREEDAKFRTPEEERKGEKESEVKIKEAADPHGEDKEAERPPEAQRTAPLMFSPKERSPARSQEMFEDFWATPKNEARREAETPQKGGPAIGSQDPTIQVILKLMEGMQEIQKQLASPPSSSKDEPEVVRPSVEVPRLPEWNAETAPIDFNDWVLCLGPIMSDLSTTAEAWWDQVLLESQKWYEAHMQLSPIARLGHRVQDPPSSTNPRWSRLEKRASAMLLSAVPEALREEVIASKAVTTRGILTKGMLMFQPGGLAERGAILSALESPAEATTISTAITSLRRWMRWKRRASEVGVSPPDATILVRGLTKLTKRVLQLHPELQFRLSLARSTLMIDTVPTQDSVGRYAEHVLAEMEQLGHQARRKEPPGDAGAAKAKRFGEAEKDGEAGRRGDQKEESRERQKCKFFLTDSGCRRGKTCKWSHDQRDDRKRCWTCGAVDHMAPTCPRKTSAEDSPRKVKAARGDQQETTSPTSTKEAAAQEEAKDQKNMKEILEEASRMLKEMNHEPQTPSSSNSSVRNEGEAKGRKEVLDKLQQQLMSMKAFRMRKMARGMEKGLLDSGATHPLRPQWSSEEVGSYRRVEVTLANGKTEKLRISRGGAMIAPNEEIEPIVPIGLLTERLGCRVFWEREGVSVWHPVRGELEVEMIAGCPQVTRKLALELIQEIEEDGRGYGSRKMKFEEEVEWMKALVERHPVLKELPAHIKDELVVEPGEWTDLPGNRHQRKKWKKGGVVIHLFSGPKEGFTLERAWKQQGGEASQLLEVDIVRGNHHDFMKDKGPYSGVMRAACEGKLRGLIGGPNCRTRSYLPHPGEPRLPQADQKVERRGVWDRGRDPGRKREVGGG